MHFSLIHSFYIPHISQPLDWPLEVALVIPLSNSFMTNNPGSVVTKLQLTFLQVHIERATGICFGHSEQHQKVMHRRSSCPCASWTYNSNVANVSLPSYLASKTGALTHVATMSYLVWFHLLTITLWCSILLLAKFLTSNTTTHKNRLLHQICHFLHFMWQVHILLLGKSKKSAWVPWNSYPPSKASPPFWFWK